MMDSSLVENDYANYPRVETSSSLPKSKYENPILASSSSRNRVPVTKTRSRIMFYIRDQCSRSFAVLFIVNILILVVVYHALTKKVRRTF